MLCKRIVFPALAVLAIMLYSAAVRADNAISEDFTGATTINNWYFYNGACLTASSASATSDPGSPPGCIKDSYYGSEPLVGGYNGVAGGSQTLPDPVPDTTGSYGALRFTNGCVDTNSNGSCSYGGHSQNGAIISANSFPTSQGLDITFKTVTYRGDSGGNGAGCPSGTTSSNGQCVTTATVTPTTGYSCANGYTLSGSNCIATVAASWNGSKYTCPSGYTKSGSGSSTICTKIVSATTSYTCPSNYTLSGSGTSSTCSQTTVVEQSPHQTEGADGMSFFLVDADTSTISNTSEDHIGSWGGSLGYTCSNINPDFHGMYGAYLGLGIDEYGNFLNGSANTLGVSNPQALGDNTATGGGQWANRIGLRGAGSIDWYWLSTTYPDLYPAAWASTTLSNGNTEAQMAVKYTCKNGYLSDYNNNALTYNDTSPYNVPDYGAIPSAYTIIPNVIADEYSKKGYSRQVATPITYRLKITENNLLSLEYSYNGGAWTSVIKNQDITTSNGSLPKDVDFGFAGSTGGASNIHEILCFKASPASQAASSTTVNQQQSSKVESGSQAYFGYYDPTDWTGRLTANSLNTDSSGNLTIASTANWDASCVLSGVASGSTCPTTGQAGPTTAEAWQTGSGARVMLTWSGSAGIPLSWSNLSTDEQSALDAGDSSQTEYRLDYLRGDRSNEIPTSGASGTKVYRDRDSVLGDIVDSSSAWVGPPSKSIFSAYETPSKWKDKLYSSDSMVENSSQTYSQYATAEAARLNVVYVGANDGLLHGFSAGSYDSTGTAYDSSTNTGQEVLAYMPQGVLESIHNSGSSSIDFANPQYGHAFYVDATPGTGDLYYKSAWHTWLVGGLGPGGSEIYALDITDPSSFSEANASKLVEGDWTGSSSSGSGTITCTNVSNCASDLGDTYGTPVVRRLHNGDWAVIFGNGFGSSSGDAGIFILTIDPSDGSKTMYYLSTGKSGSNDGIAYVEPVDMDGDHVVDYVYAGDQLGNVWRFDLTSSTASSWAVTPGPLFTTPAGQPITSLVYADFVSGPSGTQLMLFFGTGQKFPLTESSATSYQSGQQSFYGVWDWNMSGWNALKSSQFASMPASTVGTLGQSSLQLQTVAYDSTSGLPSIATPYLVCWAGTTTCSSTTLGAGTSATSSNSQYGWYINLPGSNSGYGSSTSEQVTFNPTVVSTAIQFNSILPAIDSPLMCTPDHDKGWSYALDVRNGNPVPGFFVNNGNTHTIGIETDASGTSSEVTTTGSNGEPKYYLIYQSTNGGAGTPVEINPANNVNGNRETWIQLR